MTEEQFQKCFETSLNASQREAVHAVDGAVLLLAVPGSGKTTVLVTRLGYMVCCCGIRPENILTMTYTVAATREMSARFARMFGPYCGRGIEIRTINGLSQKIIDYYSETENRTPFRLQDDEGELSALVREIYRDYYSDYPTESVIRDIRTAITYCKNSLFSQQEIEQYDIGLKHFADIYTRYTDTLRRNRQMDYDDQLLYALNILKNRPGILEAYQDQFRYICVDESQDTSRLQHELIHLLAGKHGNIFMVGDEDQSIYSFRAAYPDALVRFPEDYPSARMLVMEQNYRSTEQIIDCANHFVAKNRFRRPKKIIPTCGPGQPVQILETTGRKAQYLFLYEIAKKSTAGMAILSRNNDSAVPLIDLFERNGVLYNCRQFDEVFFSHRILRDITDIIEFSEHDRDAEIFMRIYHKLGCMISRTAAEYACTQSMRSGKPILLELIHSPELGQYSMHSITELYEALRQLPEDSAPDALSRIRYQIGYGEYVERNKLDAGKFPVLEMLARHVPNARGLLDRLEQLRILIRDHVYQPDAHVTLSTVHSSKGLEYDTVYLLDVLDGILPGKTGEASVTPEEIRQYEEERRLFYVAMTRAKKQLYLLHCTDQPSEFLKEIRCYLPRETFGDRDALAFLRTQFCGMLYQHKQRGKGRILACGETDFLLEYADGYALHSLEELIINRSRNTEIPKQEEKIPIPVPAGKLIEGSRAEHVAFGIGTVIKLDMETVTVTFEADGKTRSFLKSAVLPNGKLKPAQS